MEFESRRPHVEGVGAEERGEDNGQYERDLRRVVHVRCRGPVFTSLQQVTRLVSTKMCYNLK